MLSANTVVLDVRAGKTTYNQLGAFCDSWIVLRFTDLGAPVVANPHSLMHGWRIESMSNVSIDLPADLLEFVESKVQRGEFASVSDYVIALVNAAREKRSDIDV